MKSQKISKSNWSGEDTTIYLYEDGKRFKLDHLISEIFRIVPKLHTMGDDDPDAFHTYKVQWKADREDEWQDTDIKGMEHNKQTVGDRVLCQHHYEFTSYFGDYGRTSKEDPRIACAQHICNVF